MSENNKNNINWDNIVKKEAIGLNGEDLGEVLELETKIPVMAQNLEVTKKLTENKVKIIKEPVKEIKKIDVELTHEEIMIERIPSNNDKSLPSSSQINEDPNKSKTELIIKLKREEPVIKKYSFVKEEVVIKKKPITETKTITDVVVNERVNYDNNLNKDVDRDN